MDYIELKHFKKYLTCQPFFIWNNLSDRPILDKDIGYEKHIWDQDVLDKKEVTYGEIISRTFGLIREKLNEYLFNNYDCIVISGKKEDRIKKTIKFLNSNKILINPLFKYKNALSSPYAFDTKEKKIICLKFSKKTKISDLVPFKWHKEIISKNTIVNDYVLFLQRNKYYYKGEISLVQTNAISQTKNGFNLGEKNKKGHSKEILIKELLFGFKFKSINKIINIINDAKNETKVYSHLLDKDSTTYGKNKEIHLLLEKLNFPFAGYSGKVIAFKDIINYYKKNEKKETLNSILLNAIQKNNKATLTYKYDNKLSKKKRLYFIINEIKNSKKVIWYDFEAFSLPISPINGYGPYEQVIFQVSIIETIKNIESKKPNNIVIDPLKISNEDFYLIIKSIYSKNANCYVVYNKSYEISRMQFMVNILKKENFSKYKEAKKMFEEIELKTIDLCDLFIINSKSKLPLVLLNDQKCFYSIKNVEKHISTNNINLPRKIKKYEDLEIQNGLMAMEIGIKRALNLINDQKWNLISKKLKEYCENDVRAMIMVYDFVLKLIEEQK